MYIYAGEVHVTITDKHVTVNGISHINQYTKDEWFEMADEVLDKKHGVAWTKKWKHILESMVHAS